METEDKKDLSPEDYLERNKNASSRYMEDSRKKYLLASNTESLQTLMEKQQDELTRVLIELKSEYDLLTRRKVIRNIALLYIFELYENKDDLINIDLKNSYINDNIMTIIVCLNSLYELGLIESDLIIDFGNDLNLADILKIISNMSFKNFDKYDVKELCKRI